MATTAASDISQSLHIKAPNDCIGFHTGWYCLGHKSTSVSGDIIGKHYRVGR